MQPLSAPTRSRNRSIPWIVGAALLLGLVVSAWVLPILARKILVERSRSCLSGIDRTGEGEPGGCLPPRAVLWVLTKIPSSDAAGLKLAALDLELRLAALRTLDAEQRDELARDRVTAGPDALQRLWENGALEVLVQSELSEASNGDPKLAIDAALRLGDWEAAKQFAQRPSQDFEGARRAAGVACIMGDRARATAAVHEAEQHPDARPVELRMLEVHCELPLGPMEELSASEQADVRDAQRIYAGEDPEGKGSRGDEAGLRLVTALANAQASPLVWSGDRRASGGVFFDRLNANAARWSETVDPQGAGTWVLIEPMERAAKRLFELGREAPRSHVFEDAPSRPVAPRVLMFRAALTLALAATSERLWRGEQAAAEKDYVLVRQILETTELSPLAPTLELQALRLLGHVDRSRAEQVARAPGEIDVAQTSLVAPWERAVVLDRAGDLQRALEVSAPAWDGLVESAEDVSGDHAYFVHVPGAMLTPVHMVLMLRAERADTLERFVAVPDDLRGEPEVQEIWPYWMQVAQAEGPAQLDLRWRSSAATNLALPGQGLFLPLTYELIARGAAPKGRETLLDTVSAALRIDPLAVVRARRTAAERLEDEAAAERWREREAALLAELDGDRDFALYRVFVLDE